MTADKQLARTYLTDISSFKTILSSAESYDALEGRVNEIQALGEEYFNAFIFFAPWLEIVGGRTYQEASLWYELSAGKSVYVLYGLSKINAMLPEVVGRPPARWRSPFNIRSSRHTCSLILGWLRLTYSICQLSKFVSSTKIQTSGNNISILIEGHSGGGLVEENSTEHSGRTGMELVS